MRYIPTLATPLRCCPSSDGTPWWSSWWRWERHDRPGLGVSISLTKKSPVVLHREFLSYPTCYKTINAGGLFCSRQTNQNYRKKELIPLVFCPRPTWGCGCRPTARRTEVWQCPPWLPASPMDTKDWLHDCMCFSAPFTERLVHLPRDPKKQLCEAWSYQTGANSIFFLGLSQLIGHMYIIYIYIYTLYMYVHGCTKHMLTC